MTTGDTLLPIALNYNRNESNLATTDEAAISEAIGKQNLENFAVLDIMKKGVSKSLADVAEGTQLWRWFIVAALLFLLAEIAILRLMK